MSIPFFFVLTFFALSLLVSIKESKTDKGREREREKKREMRGREERRKTNI